MSREIRLEQLKKYRENYLKNDKLKVSQRAVIKNGIFKVAENQSAIINSQPVFSLELETGKVTAQQKSGRCWIFGTLNTFRYKIAKDIKVKDFELSQNYMYFWDKIEKANYFLENIIKYIDEDKSDRHLTKMFGGVQWDGGDWSLCKNLTNKYGIVPKYLMPETNASVETPEFNAVINKKLRVAGIALRKMLKNGATEQEIENKKDEVLGEIYNIVATTLGNPPETFDFEYRDDDNNYHIDRNLTPKKFYDKYVGYDLEDYVSLSNNPSKDRPYLKRYIIGMIGNIIEGQPSVHVNVDMETLKQATIKQLEAGEPVWFGCDVGQSYNRILGIMSHEMYDIEGTFDIDLTMNKEERLSYRESTATHIMVITGVDIVDGKPTKWKVENSWGDKIGTKGYFVMTDEWMNEFTYHVTVKKEYLNEEVKAVLEDEPIYLEPWEVLLY